MGLRLYNLFPLLCGPIADWRPVIAAAPEAGEGIIAEVNQMRENAPALNEEGPQQLVEVTDDGAAFG